MADLATNIDILPTGLSQPEVPVNDLINGLSPGMLFARRALTTAGLTWGYYGGPLLIGTTPTFIANGTVALTASATNYVEATSAGAVSANTSAFTGGRIQLYIVTTNASGPTNWIEKRYSQLGITLIAGSVTSVDAASGVETVAGTPITTTGTIRGKETVNNQTGTSYAILDGDRGKLVTISNGSPIAVSIAQAGAASSFLAGWYVDVQNRGAGLVTITPTTSTVDGASTLTLAQNDGARLVSDGTNYYTFRGRLRAFTSADLPAQKVAYGIACSDESTAITTGTAVVTIHMPHAMILTEVRATLSTASSSGTPTVDIKEAGTTILSTLITIDASEKTSTTAATPPVISDANLADVAEITIDITVAGTGAKGLKVWLIGTRVA